MPAVKPLLICILLLLACAVARAQVIVATNMGVINTTYGTASSVTSFTVSGSQLSAGVLVTPPPGMQVSADNATFASTVTVGDRGSFAPTTVYVRFSALAPAKVYNNNIVLSSPGTTTNVAIPDCEVRPAVIDLAGAVPKRYGTQLNNYTLFFDDPVISFDNSQMKNGNKFYSMDLVFSAGNNANAPVGTYPGAIQASNFKGQSGFLASNYIIKYTPMDLVVQPVPLTIQAFNAMKQQGTVLNTQAGSVNFKSEGLKNNETIGSITVSYGTGSEISAAVSKYVGSVVPSAAVGGTFNAANYTITYLPGDLNVYFPSDAVILTNTSPAAVTTTFGTASASTSFSLSAANLTAPVLVTAPKGFEVSIDNLNFAKTVSVGGPPAINNAIAYLRLTSTDNAKVYNDTIVLSTAGALPVGLVIPSSRINKAPLAIRARTVTKVYGDKLVDFNTATEFDIRATEPLRNGNTITKVAVVYADGAAANADVQRYYNSIDLFIVEGANGFSINNYQLTTENGHIDVVKAPLTIKMKDVDKPYGTALTGRAGWANVEHSLKNGERLGSVTISYKAGNNAGDRVDTYVGAIEGSALTGGNYKPSNYTAPVFINGNINVTLAPLMIKLDDKTRTFNTPDPPFTYSYSGFVNGEDESIITEKLNITTTATLSSPAGKYPITVGMINAPNYSMQYLEGTLTIVNDGGPINPGGPGNPGNPVTNALGITSVFTPNGDGVNDVWTLAALASYPKCRVNVFNRNGQNIFTSVGYPVPWDATLKGANLPSGVYYYVIDLRDGSKPVSGSISVLR